jgi:hypothetical protein
VRQEAGVYAIAAMFGTELPSWARESVIRAGFRLLDFAFKGDGDHAEDTNVRVRRA